MTLRKHGFAKLPQKEARPKINFSVNLAVEGNHVPGLEPAIGENNQMPALAVDD